MTKKEKLLLLSKNLKELQDAGITIGSCGCCNSPYIMIGDESFDSLYYRADGSITVDHGAESNLVLESLADRFS